MFGIRFHELGLAALLALLVLGPERLPGAHSRPVIRAYQTQRHSTRQDVARQLDADDIR
nr:hypothetical protein [Pseudomonas lopnurensis]